MALDLDEGKYMLNRDRRVEVAKVSFYAASSHPPSTTSQQQESQVVDLESVLQTCGSVHGGCGFSSLCVCHLSLWEPSFLFFFLFLSSMCVLDLWSFHLTLSFFHLDGFPF